MGIYDQTDVNDFLNHSGSEGGGGGGTFLRDWKKGDKIDLWPHPAARPVPYWTHRWYRVRKNKDSGERERISMRWRSLESEKVLKNRYRRTKGKLDHPPVIDPFALLIEEVQQAIRSDVISWVDEIFEFTDSDDDPLTIHAGGFVGLFGKKEMSDKEKSELRRAGIRRDEAWMENSNVRLQYIFSVVKHASPDEGTLIAIEAETLGNQVKKVIRDCMENFGADGGDPDRGNPFVTPYAFRWSFDDSLAFDKKYSARAMTTLALKPEIEDLFASDPPDLSDLLALGNVAKLRESFEAHWVHPDWTPDWDSIFEEAEKLAAQHAAVEDDVEDLDDELAPIPKTPIKKPATRVERKPAPEPEPVRKSPAAATKRKPAPEPEPVEEELDPILCDVCEAELAEDEFTCKNCGTEYSDSGAILKRGTPPKKRTRSRTARDENDLPEGM